MSEVSDAIMEQVENSPESKLNSLIALVVAISASMVAVFNIKDNNIVQAMAQAQAHAIDQWAYYQAKGVKQNIAENEVETLTLKLKTEKSLSAQDKVELQKLIDLNKSRTEKYEKEKIEIKKQAEGFQEEYDSLNVHDDQFDLAEALISVALSIFGITALTRKRSLFYFGLTLSLIGTFYGFAGFFHWSFHSDLLAKILG